MSIILFLRCYYAKTQTRQQFHLAVFCTERRHRTMYQLYRRYEGIFPSLDQSEQATFFKHMLQALSKC